MREDGLGHFRKLSLASATLGVLAVFVLMAGQRWYAAVHEEAQVIEEQARMVSANAGAALAAGDAQAARGLLLNLARGSRVDHAAFYRADGRLLAHEGRTEIALPAAIPAVWLTRETHSLSLRGWRIAIPIVADGQAVGAIVAWSSLTAARRELINFTVVFVLIAAVAAILSYASSRVLRRRMLASQAALADSQTLIRQLGIHREKLVEEEHKRIAMEIHDDLGQVLTTARLALERLRRRLAEGGRVTPDQIDEIESLVSDAFRSVRNIAADLRPPVLSIGLGAAIEWLAERILVPAGIQFEFDQTEHLPVLDDRCSITLFRLVQESLTNVVRHSKARRVNIGLRADRGQLALTITDDGIGFRGAPQDGKAHFGLLGIRERAESLHGRATIESALGAGTRIAVTVPIATASAESIDS